MKTGVDRSALLDCIRTVAILMVIVFHVGTRYPYSELDPLAHVFMKYGYLGVDLFFPLSGFLITRFLLARTGSEHVRTFFLRRFFRIVPLYAAAVLTFFLGSVITGYDEHILHRIWITATFLSGWFIFFDGIPTVPFTITWSLSVEEFAYILTGLFALASRAGLPAFLWTICFFSIALRFWLNALDYENMYYFPPTRLDSVAVGGLLAVMMSRGVRGLGLWIAAITSVLFVLALSLELVWDSMLLTIVALLTCLLITLFEGPMRNVRAGWITWFSRIGFYSYFLYLFHFFVLHGLTEALRTQGLELPPFWVMVVLCTGLTQLAAVLSFRFFEQPLMLFGRRLERAGTPDGERPPADRDPRPASAPAAMK